MDLPPLQTDLGFLRLSVVLAQLCNAVYTGRAADVGSTIPLEVPLVGPDSHSTVVRATLLHFRLATPASQPPSSPFVPLPPSFYD